MFLSRREQRLYEIRFVWIQKDVGEKRGTIRTHWNADCLLEDFSGNEMIPEMIQDDPMIQEMIPETINIFKLTGQVRNSAIQ